MRAQKVTAQYHRNACTPHSNRGPPTQCVILSSSVSRQSGEYLPNVSRTHNNREEEGKMKPRRILRFLWLLLSINAALLADNSWSDSLIVAGPSGGGGGSFVGFERLLQGEPQLKIAEIRVRSGRYIDSIEVRYHQITNGQCTGSPLVTRIGGSGGTLRQPLLLGCFEHVTQIRGRYGKYVDSLEVLTSEGQSIRWGGSGGTSEFLYTGADTGIVGLWGRGGRLVDALGVVFRVFSDGLP